MPVTEEKSARTGAGPDTVDSALNANAEVPSLDDLLSNATLTERRPAPSANPPLTFKCTNQDGGFTVAITDREITMSFAKGSDVKIEQTLSPEEKVWLKKFIETRPDNFFPNQAFDGNRKEILKGIQYAQLHAAFFATPGSPLEAAEKLCGMLRSTLCKGYDNHEWPGAKLTIVKDAPTSSERLEGLLKMADGMSQLGGYLNHHRKDVADQRLADVKDALQDHVNRKLAETGSQILDRMLGTTPEVTLEDLIAATEQNFREKVRPVRIEIEVKAQDYVYFKAAISIESTADGMRAFFHDYSRMRPEQEVHSLGALVRTLESASGYESKEARWKLTRPYQIPADDRRFRSA